MLVFGRADVLAQLPFGAIETRECPVPGLFLPSIVAGFRRSDLFRPLREPGTFVFVVHPPPVFERAKHFVIACEMAMRERHLRLTSITSATIVHPSAFDGGGFHTDSPCKRLIDEIGEEPAIRPVAGAEELQTAVLRAISHRYNGKAKDPFITDMSTVPLGTEHAGMAWDRFEAVLRAMLVAHAETHANLARLRFVTAHRGRAHLETVAGVTPDGEAAIAAFIAKIDPKGTIRTITRKSSPRAYSRSWGISGRTVTIRVDLSDLSALARAEAIALAQQSDAIARRVDAA